MPHDSDRGRFVGSLIAAAFGLVYVVVNSWPLPAAAAWSLRALAIVACALTVAAAGYGARPWERDGSRGPSGTGGPPPEFPRAYWGIVAAEVAALFGGLAVINGALGAPHAGVAWVSLVVGIHFFPMAHVFRLPFFHVIGGIIAACGVLGLVFAALDSTGGATAVAAGVIPGFVLLGSGLWGAAPRQAPGGGG